MVGIVTETGTGCPPAIRMHGQPTRNEAPPARIETPAAALPSGTRPVLRTASLQVSYGNGIRALQSNSLTFNEGAFIVLLGASGAGKSTLLRSLNGLVRPTAGHVVAEGLGDLADRNVLRRHRRQAGSFNSITSSGGAQC